MKEMKEMTFDEALQFIYDNLGQIFGAFEIVILWLLNRNIKKCDKITTSVSSKSSIFKAADQKMEISPAVSSQKTVKKQLTSQLMSDLELLFSQKEDDQLTEDEKTRISALTSYFTEVNK